MHKEWALNLYVFLVRPVYIQMFKGADEDLSCMQLYLCMLCTDFTSTDQRHSLLPKSLVPSIKHVKEAYNFTLTCKGGSNFTLTCVGS